MYKLRKKLKRNRREGAASVDHFSFIGLEVQKSEWEKSETHFLMEQIILFRVVYNVVRRNSE